MRWLEALIRNHPLANVVFALVIGLGVLGYLAMPREQDPDRGVAACRAVGATGLCRVIGDGRGTRRGFRNGFAGRRFSALLRRRKSRKQPACPSVLRESAFAVTDTQLGFEGIRVLVVDVVARGHADGVAQVALPL